MTTRENDGGGGGVNNGDDSDNSVLCLFWYRYSAATWRNARHKTRKNSDTTEVKGHI